MPRQMDGEIVCVYSFPDLTLGKIFIGGILVWCVCVRERETHTYIVYMQHFCDVTYSFTTFSIVPNIIYNMVFPYDNSGFCWCRNTLRTQPVFTVLFCCNKLGLSLLTFVSFTLSACIAVSSIINHIPVSALGAISVL